MSKSKLFILPPRSILDDDVEHGGMGYSLYNYYGSGPVARAKRARFERALRIGRGQNGGRAIDMGCADGLLIPSLARHYERVAAIDRDRVAMDTAQRLVDRLSLPNVTLLCSDGMGFAEIRDHIGTGYGTMYLLETLEHVGEQPDMWGSKMAFLEECFSLLEPGGTIVISVPKMVGPIILFKNLLQRTMFKYHDSLPPKQLLKSAFLYNTDDLEPLWEGSHVGFNHRKLERHLRDRFNVRYRAESLISAFYVLARR
jgi:2-polyprenyl-3-methyl-5-hydroxy-6-metoxy-1,4-benzoquinol methylase